MDYIPKQEYEEMYAMLHIEASGNVSQKDSVTRNSAIYERYRNPEFPLHRQNEEKFWIGTDVSLQEKVQLLRGYAAHGDDILFTGKTGTAEIRASKDDTLGTELGWFAVFTAEDAVERPILIIIMAEDVKGRGGSGYVVKRDNLVLEE